MRRWIKGSVLVIVVLLLIAGVAMLILPRAPKYEVKMPDGTTLRVEQLNYGKRDPFQPGSWWQKLKENVAKHLPKEWADRLAPPIIGSSQWSSGMMPTNGIALNIWLTRRKPGGMGFENVGLSTGELVDEDGCVYAPAQVGGEDKGLLANPATLMVASAPGTTVRAGAFTLTGSNSQGNITYTLSNSTAAAGGGVGGGAVFLAPASNGAPVGANWGGGGGRGGPQAAVSNTIPRPAMRGGGGGGWSSVASNSVGRGGGGGFATTASGVGFFGGFSPQSSVTWLSFANYPRFDKMLHLRVYDPQHALLGEFDLPNPNRLPYQVPPNWTANKPPVTKTEGDLSFALTDISIKTNKFRSGRGGVEMEEEKQIAAKFEARERGQLVDFWDAVDMELTGASGNMATKTPSTLLSLCPREPAWKLKVKFAGSEVSALAPNASSKVKSLSIPGEGEWTDGTNDQKLSGVGIKLVAFGGPGVMTFSNNVPVTATPPDGNAPGVYSSSGGFGFGGRGGRSGRVGGAGGGQTAVPATRGPIGGGGGSSGGSVGGGGVFGGGFGSGGFGGGGPGLLTTTTTVRAATPYVALLLNGMTDDQRLTVRAIDDQGREVYGQEITAGSWNAHSSTSIPYIKANPRGRLTIVALKLPSDAKTVDLVFCIHNLRTEDFTFKPPGGNQP